MGNGLKEQIGYFEYRKSDLNDNDQCSSVGNNQSTEELTIKIDNMENIEEENVVIVVEEIDVQYNEETGEEIPYPDWNMMNEGGDGGDGGEGGE